MNALQKVKLTKELLSLVASLKGGQLKALDKVKTTKRVLELVSLLGGAAVAPVVNDYTELLQGIVNGTINVFTAKEKLTELEKALTDLGGDDMPDGDTKQLMLDALKAAAKQVIEGQGYQVAA